ncbi:helix-turn-helix domain-containing protein [Actinobacillus porcinus]|uniref:helix-turn-helix domain-containing protein n=1 Tax=Actinobacillus porcinus TaxID=51048 RepID=UPI00235605DF|nr:helix-turn-helix domain-containing protein [Actinobacillus porcinus]
MTDTTLFEDLMTGLSEIEQHMKGEIELPSYTLSRPEQLEKTGDEVRSIRDELHLSQSELAKRLRMSVRTLQNWEQGRTLPNPHSLMLLRMARREPKLFEVVASL